MYVSISDARAREELNIPDVSAYPDALVTHFINRAQAIVDNFLGQTIEVQSDVQERVNSIPNMLGGVHIQLSTRFITNIDSIVIEYGYGIDDYTMQSDQYQLNNELGYIETNCGAQRPALFNNQDIQHYVALVQYDSGIATLPSDFTEAFYAVMFKVIDSWKMDNETDSTPQSNKVESYRTLTEQMKFAKNSVKDALASGVLEDWVEDILKKYAMPKIGIGVRI